MQEMGVISNKVPHEISFSKDYEKRTMYIYNIGPLAARRYLANGDEIVMRLVTQRGRYERKSCPYLYIYIVRFS